MRSRADTFRQNGITEFTISSDMSGLIQTLAAFDKQGFKMDGITEINANHTNFRSNEKAKVPAIRMKRV